MPRGRRRAPRSGGSLRARSTRREQRGGSRERGRTPRACANRPAEGCRRRHHPLRASVMRTTDELLAALDEVVRRDLPRPRLPRAGRNSRRALFARPRVRVHRPRRSGRTSGRALRSPAAVRRVPQGSARPRRGRPGTGRVGGVSPEPRLSRRAHLGGIRATRDRKGADQPPAANVNGPLPSGRGSLRTRSTNRTRDTHTTRNHARSRGERHAALLPAGRRRAGRGAGPRGHQQPGRVGVQRAGRGARGRFPRDHLRPARARRQRPPGERVHLGGDGRRLPRTTRGTRAEAGAARRPQLRRRGEHARGRGRARVRRGRAAVRLVLPRV